MRTQGAFSAVIRGRCTSEQGQIVLHTSGLIHKIPPLFLTPIIVAGFAISLQVQDLPVRANGLETIERGHFGV